MLGTYFALRALVLEWRARVVGATLADVYSSSRDELSVVLLGLDEQTSTLRISFGQEDRFLFRQEGGGRPRRNATTLFPDLIGARVREIRVADRDRVIDLLLTGERGLRIVLFGPRANAVSFDADDRVLDSFRTKLASRGDAAPASRPAELVDTLGALQERWPAQSQSLQRAVNRAIPLADALIAQEVVDRAALTVHDGCLVVESDLERLLGAWAAVRAELGRPRPCFYRDGRVPVAFALFPLTRPPGAAREDFDSVDDAARQYVRARLSHRAFHLQYRPLLTAIERAESQSRDRVERMQGALAEPGRADRHEHWGHLLMAGPDERAGAEEILVPDLFGDGEAIRIRLDPALTRYENAARLYEKARRSRRAREEAQKRLKDSVRERASALALLQELREVSDRESLQLFRSQHAAGLHRFEQTGAASSQGNPFRRYVLEGGYEVWVGRNSRQNDKLTFEAARKYDYWLHARGVAGSHVILRRPRRTETPPRHLIERAAAIAAFHSKARGSAMVPVIVVERKFVRKPKGAAPGAVIVEREDVVLVEPFVPPE